jgi:hypothetical protein
MTSNHDRIQAVTELGFRERQARFLVLVMRHAGVCVPRQYARFAGVAYGAKCNAFFDRLVRRGFARPSECIHNRARLYHLHSKSLYHVIGQARSRHRRSVSPRLAIERIMLLDAVLTTPDLEWLTTTSQKSDYLAKKTASAASAHALVEDAASSERESKATADLPGAFPIGVEPNGRTVLLYVATEASTDAFRSFLQAHVALLRVAANWTLRIVCPRPLGLLYDAYQTVVHDELESPLHSATIGELKWYFENLDQATREPVHPQTQTFLNVGDRVFRARRFTEMYQRWLKYGDAVFEGPSSPVIAEALSTGAGRVESFVLPHSYRHLSPLVDRPRSRTEDVEKGVEKGAAKGDITSARPQPPVSTPWSPRERSIVM